MTDEEIAALKLENSILHNIITLIPGNIFWKDKEGRFLGCNNNVAHILGYNSPKDIIGKRHSDFSPPEIAQMAEQIDNEVFTTAQEQYIEEIGNTFNQQPAIYLSKKMPLFDPHGEVMGLLGVSFDITDRKNMEVALKETKERAEASNRAKTQFLSVVTHELRTPISSILGLIEFLRQGHLLPYEEKNIVDAIENCTQHLLNLVNDMLDFSRLENTKYNPRVHAIHLKTMFEEVFALVKPLAENKGIKLRILASDGAPECILTDPRILQQILMNLVGNAIKFTEKGSICIQTNVLKTLENKCKIEIAVIDTGHGIPADKLDAIFEPFHQLEDAYTRQSSRSGTGLGLTIVKKIAAIIGAKIQVKSVLGEGSKFSLIGKFETTSTAPTPLLKKERKTFSKNTLSFTNTRAPKILLVEDDPIVQYVHQKMLADLGCKVDIVAHGHEVIPIMKDHDIVFVDISLPDISGFEVMKAIREWDKTKKVSIIALTVYTGEEEKAACLAAGADDFASKPISQECLLELLEKHLV